MTTKKDDPPVTPEAQEADDASETTETEQEVSSEEETDEEELDDEEDDGEELDDDEDDDEADEEAEDDDDDDDDNEEAEDDDEADEEAEDDDEANGEQDADGEEDDKADEGEEAKARPARKSSRDDLEEIPPRLISIVESLLFAAEKPLKPAQIRKLVGERSLARLKRVLAALVEQRADTGIVVAEVDGGYQLRTNPENARWVKRMDEVKPIRMSRAALEVVAVVAYRQPVTRAEIDQIRGVDSGGSLKQVLSRDLVRILGRKEEPGRPFVYGTTHEFLSFFSLSSLSEMPPLRSVSELAGSEEEEEQEQEALTELPLGETEATEGEAPQGAPPEEEADGEEEADDESIRPPTRPVVPEISPEDIEADEDDFDEFDEGDDEVLEALAAASDAARGADRVKRTLKKMAQDEAEAGPSSPEASLMLESIEQLVAARRKKKPAVEQDAEGEGEGEGAAEGTPGESTPPEDGAVEQPTEGAAPPVADDAAEASTPTGDDPDGTEGS